MKTKQTIASAFKPGRPALMPYFTLGFPDYETSLDVVQACAAAGADLIELGIPFSDPLADGPTIQHSTQIALENGMTVARCLQAVSELRSRAVSLPLILMGYINPLLAYGLERFVTDAVRAGVNGLIIPDLPLEEGTTLEALCQCNGLDLVYLLAPNSTAARIRQVSAHSTGFIYLVSVTGITGARQSLAGDLVEFVGRVRAETEQPLAVGFGISTPQQATAVAQMADGVIVGSALIRAVAESQDDPVGAARTFVAALRQAL